MRRTRLTYEERLNRLKLLKLKQALDNRKAKLFNLFYHNSFFYKSTFFIRITFLILVTVVSLTYYQSAGFVKEKIVSTRVEKITSSRKFGRRSTIRFSSFETNKGSYNSYYNLSGEFQPGDVVFIEKNIYGKGIRFKKTKNSNVYDVNFNYLMYIIGLITTIFSFQFKIGIYSFTRKMVLFTSIFDAVLIGWFVFFWS